MDKDIFYGKRKTERGVAVVPLHPSDSELDSSDDDTSDETVHADTSVAPASQEDSVTSTPDRLTRMSLERCRRSLSASSSCPPSKKAKGRNRVLVPVSDDDDSDKPSKGPSKKLRKWDKVDIPNIKVPEKIHGPVSEVKSPYAYFTFMFTDKLVDLITFQTNLYSTQQQGKSIATNAEEIRRFLGILVLMGVYKFPSLEDYWSLDGRFPPVADVMPLKRFQALRRYVHFANNLDQGSNSDRFSKVRPLFQNLREQFLKIPAERKQSIDEVMVAYKGTRAGNLRQYVSNKPDKWGFKIFCRSSSTGFIHDMLLYQGSSTFFNVSLSSKEQSLLLGAKVVLTLSRTIDEPQHSVLFFDNFFTNYDLIQLMKAELDIHCVGTVRANRSGGANGFLKEDKILSKEKRGAIDYCSSEGVIAVKWHDNRCVTLLSNAHGIEPLSYVKRYNAEEKTKVPVTCPAVVQAYNEHMGGIDLSDMLVHLYKTPSKSRRWHFPLFAYSLDVSIVNAWLLYKRDCFALNEKILPLKDFRVSVGKSLKSANQVLVPRPVGRPPMKALQLSVPKRKHAMPSDNARYDNVSHWPVAALERAFGSPLHEGNQTRGRCAMCHKGVSGFKCAKCNVFLCLKGGNNCFLTFHTR